MSSKLAESSPDMGRLTQQTFCSSPEVLDRSRFFFFFTFHNCFVPIGISSMGNLGCLPQGKPAATVVLSNPQCMLGVLVFL